MTEKRIPVPSFDATLTTLLELVAESPHRTSELRYRNADGLPECIVAHAYTRLDGDISVLDLSTVAGQYQNSSHLDHVWDVFFDDPWHRQVGFATRDAAENYLVRALLAWTQRAQDAGRPWLRAAAQGLYNFRRFLNSPTSGFLIQTHGHHEDLYKHVDSLTAAALSTLQQR